jgi:hypothetical protein
MFLRYLSLNKAYRVYNLWTKTVMETINVVIDNNIKEYIRNNLNNMFEAA